MLKSPSKGGETARRSERSAAQRRAAQRRGLPAGGSGHLPGVGPVPEDSVAVGHHLGRRVLAEHTHPNKEDEEQDHFHLRHV